MRTRYASILSVLFFILSGSTGAQTVLTLQPDAGAGKDALIQMRNTIAPSIAASNYGDLPSFEAVAWTWSGDPGTIRSLVEFDLTSIPSNAVITDARLSLYNDPTSSECGGQSLSLTGSNAAVLKRINSAWNESTVSWNNQPTTTDQNQVDLLQSTSAYQDYINMDVTAILNDMFQNPSSSFGFMIELDTETYYRSMIFASSDHPDCERHPKLVITYNSPTPLHVITIKPDAASGKDALIEMRNSFTSLADSNRGDQSSFEAVAWTWSGDPGVIRSLLEFNISSIPANAVVTDARLSLYNDSTSSESGGQSLSLTGSNVSLLRRITSAWNESTVTWNTQPATTNQNEVTLPQSTDPHEDYLNIDVTALVADMLQNPSTSFGFMIRLHSELYYRSLIFASSDHPECNRHPSLEISYTIPSSIHESTDGFQFDLFPNPSTGLFSISWDPVKNDFSELKIENCLGQNILKKPITSTPGSLLTINLASQAQGIYFVTLSGKEHRVVRKLILE